MFINVNDDYNSYLSSNAIQSYSRSHFHDSLKPFCDININLKNLNAVKEFVVLLIFMNSDHHLTGINPHKSHMGTEALVQLNLCKVRTVAVCLLIGWYPIMAHAKKKLFFFEYWVLRINVRNWVGHKLKLAQMSWNNEKDVKEYLGTSSK